MQYDIEPGNFIVNPSKKSWGIGQVQSIIKNKATVNFQNVGKQVINLDNLIVITYLIYNINLKHIVDIIIIVFVLF